MTSRFLLLLLVVCQTWAVKPGVKMRLTQPGVNYANKVARLAVLDLIQKMKIENYEGKSGKTNFWLSNIHSESVTPPNSEMTLSPGLNGLTWTVTNFGIKLYTDWRVKHKVWFVPISVSGGLSADFSGVRLSLTIGVDLDGESHPVLRSRGCSAEIGGLNLKFRGGLVSWILNLFKGLFENKVKSMVRDKICSLVEQKINGVVADEVKQMRVSVDIAKRFVLDYGFTAPVIFASGYMETQHSGEVYWKDDRRPTPYTPADIPDGGETSKMLYIWLTDFTALTFGYAAHTHGYLQYTLSSDKLKGNNSNYLDTSCPTSICAGSIIPEIAERYPNSRVTIQIASAAPPEIKFTTNGIDIVLLASVIFSAGSSNAFLDGSVSFTLSGSASVRNDLIFGSISHSSIQISNVNSTIGNVDQTQINRILDLGIQAVILPQINSFAQEGIPLPTLNGITLPDSQITFQDGYLVVSTNVQYKDVQ